MTAESDEAKVIRLLTQDLEAKLAEAVRFHIRSLRVVKKRINSEDALALHLDVGVGDAVSMYLPVKDAVEELKSEHSWMRYIDELAYGLMSAAILNLQMELKIVARPQSEKETP